MAVIPSISFFRQKLIWAAYPGSEVNEPHNTNVDTRLRNFDMAEPSNTRFAGRREIPTLSAFKIRSLSTKHGVISIQFFS